MQVVIEAKTMADFNEQIASLYHETHGNDVNGPGTTSAQDALHQAQPTQYPEGSTGPNGGLVSQEQEWMPTGVNNGYSPQDLPATPEALPMMADPAVVNAPDIITAATGDLDCKGLPWDKRIHSDKKSKNVDGSWRNRRGVDKDLLAQVTAELTNTTTATTAAIPAAPLAVAPEPSLPPAAQPTPVAQTGGIVPGGQPGTDTTPVLAPDPQAQQYAPTNVPTATQPAHSLATFTANLPMVLTELVQKGSITQDYITQLNTHFKVAQIFDVAKSPEQTKNLFTFLVSQGLITEVA